MNTTLEQALTSGLSDKIRAVAGDFAAENPSGWLVNATIAKNRHMDNAESMMRQRKPQNWVKSVLSQAKRIEEQITKVTELLTEAGFRVDKHGVWEQ